MTAERAGTEAVGVKCEWKRPGPLTSKREPRRCHLARAATSADSVGLRTWTPQNDAPPPPPDRRRCHRVSLAPVVTSSRRLAAPWRRRHLLCTRRAIRRNSDRNSIFSCSRLQSQPRRRRRSRSRAARGLSPSSRTPRRSSRCRRRRRSRSARRASSCRTASSPCSRRMCTRRNSAQF